LGRNRKNYREKKKLKKIEAKRDLGLIGSTNLFGHKDYTPYNACKLMAGKSIEADIRF
jgi:hypothetical protein